MKVCPTCKETYKDDNLNFCLADGTTLIRKKSVASAPVASVHSRVNEVLAIALLALGVLVFFCLISWSPNDWSLNSTGLGQGHKTENWIGIVGAVVSDLLFQAAGVIAYVLPILLGLIAWRIFQAENLKPRTSRIVGFLLFVASAAGIVSTLGMHGGMIGALLAFYSKRLLGGVGAGVFLVAVFTVATLLVTNFSFGWLVGHLELAWENFKLRISDWDKKRRDAKAERQAALKERLAKRLELRKNRAAEAVAAPTISIGEPSPSVRKRTRAAKAAAATAVVTNPFESIQAGSAENFDDEMIPPTIAVGDKPGKAKGTTELADGELPFEDRDAGQIPITPKKGTGELNGGTGGLNGNGDHAEDEDVLNADEITPVASNADAKNFENYVLPSSQLLNPADPHIEQKEKELLAIADSLAEKTKEFNVAGKVVNICPGPVVTTYEFKPDPGVKYSRVTGLVDDLCLALRAESIRIDRIPGKAFVGIEVPNHRRETIALRDVVESKKFRESEGLLTIALGKTIDGLNYVADLAKMPHLLIAGATGAGKSVGVNSLVVSILYKSRPDQVKFIMVDPKRLELGLYADIPHLATPIITDPKRAAISLKWAVTEMERRYKDLAGYGVRNIDGYNAEAKRRNDLEQWDDNGEPHRTLPYIVIIIDELADLMMVSGKEVEESITRLAQMARAVGIHLVLATQRPSVDVITGLIKANFPARISFRVSSKVDSRTIIDGNGAEGLLGKGDMLFLPPASSSVVRVHGAYIDEREIGRIVDHIKAQGKPEYDTTITRSDEELGGDEDLPGKRDPLFWDALKCVVNARRGSTSLLQRHLRIGYGRAAAILDAMVKEGYIGDMDGSSRARPVLQKAFDDLQDLSEMHSE